MSFELTDWADAGAAAPRSAASSAARTRNCLVISLLPLCLRTAGLKACATGVRSAGLQPCAVNAPRAANASSSPVQLDHLPREVRENRMVESKLIQGHRSSFTGRSA